MGRVHNAAHLFSPEAVPDEMSRTARLSRFTGVAALFAGLTLAMLWPVRFEVNTGFWESLMNAAHAPIFAGVTALLFWREWPTRGSRRWRVAAAALGAFTFAAIIEILQSGTGRTSSLVDLAIGSGGILAAASACCGYRSAAWTTAVVVVAFAGWPVWAEARALYWRARSFPLLGDLESPSELRLWVSSPSSSITPVHARATRGNSALRITVRPGEFPGVRLLCGDQDWSGKAAFAFDLYNEGPPFALALRIDDDASRSKEDRFSRAFEIRKGANAIRIPLDEIKAAPLRRALNLAAIRQIVWFQDHPQSGQSYFLDNVRLE